MKTEEKALEQSRIELTVTVEPEEVREWIAAWCEKNEREGGLLSSFDTCDLADEAVQRKAKGALLAYGDYAVMDNRTPSPLARPVLVARSEVTRDEPFSFSIIYIPFPQMNLTSYDPVEVRVMPIVVTEEEIDQRVRDMIKDMPATQSKAAGAVVEVGDTVEISMKATANGEPYSALTSSMREYRIGDLFMPQAFEDMLVGMGVDDVASCDLVVPKVQEPKEEGDFCEVTVEVKVLRIMRDDVSSLSDESVRRLFPGMGSLEQLRRGVRQTIVDEKRLMQRDYKLGRVMDALARRVDAPLPDEVYEAQYEASLRGLDEQLKAAGMTRDEFFKGQNTNESQFRIAAMMDIRSQLTQSIALDAVARHAELEPTDADRAAFFTMVAQTEGEEAVRDLQEGSYAAALDESIKRLMAQELVMEQAIEKEIPRR